MGAPITRWIVLLILASLVMANPAILNDFSRYVRGQFNSAVEAPEKGKMPEYVLEPGQKPTKNTTLYYNGKAHTITYDSSKVGKAGENYGISIDNPAPKN